MKPLSNDSFISFAKWKIIHFETSFAAIVLYSIDILFGFPLKLFLSSIALDQSKFLSIRIFHCIINSGNRTKNRINSKRKCKKTDKKIKLFIRPFSFAHFTSGKRFCWTTIHCICKTNSILIFSTFT